MGRGTFGVLTCMTRDGVMSVVEFLRMRGRKTCDMVAEF